MVARITRPEGRKPDKLIRDALILSLHREAQDEHGQKTKRLHLIADRLVKLACDGDLDAIREIADRVDGRPVAQLPGSTEGGHLVVVVNRSGALLEQAPVLIEQRRDVAAALPGPAADG